MRTRAMLSIIAMVAGVWLAGACSSAPPPAGSDSGAITTTTVVGGNHWEIPILPNTPPPTTIA